MIRSRLALLAWSVVAVAVAVSGEGWIVGALLVAWFMAIAPGSAACRLLRIPRERDWITVVASSFAIDTVGTELMLYSHVWTPERGIVALAALTAALVGADAIRSRS